MQNETQQKIIDNIKELVRDINFSNEAEKQAKSKRARSPGLKVLI